MNEIHQLVGIASACGWTQIEDVSERFMMSPGFLVKGYPAINPIIGQKQKLPDYFNDLNAIHSAEREWLKTASLEEISMWVDNLYRAVGLNPFVDMAQELRRLQNLLKY